MDQEDPSVRITQGIEIEKGIIRIHKERQAQILKQISVFKLGMQSQISNLTEENKSVITNQEKMKKEKEEESKLYEENIELLNQKIFALQKQNENSMIQKDDYFTKNVDELKRLKLEINGKKTIIEEIKKAKIASKIIV